GFSTNKNIPLRPAIDLTASAENGKMLMPLPISRPKVARNMIIALTPTLMAIVVVEICCEHCFEGARMEVGNIGEFKSRMTANYTDDHLQFAFATCHPRAPECPGSHKGGYASPMIVRHSSIAVA